MNRPELNQKLKERFFAQYHGQKLMYYDSEDGPQLFHANSEGGRHSFLYLLLRPISHLTDEEAKRILSIFDEDDSYTDQHGFDIVGFFEFAEAVFTEPAGGMINGYTAQEYSNFIDYIRSIGIATAFMGYSVEELVQAGWIKLRPTPDNVETL